MKNRLISVLLILAMLFMFSACSDIADDYDDYESTGYQSEPLDGTLIVNYIDVGQGDSIFIEFPDGRTMLIDAGTYEAGKDIKNFIQAYGYDYITYLVATHPHSDHIGSMAYIVRNFDIGSVYMPKVSNNTTSYEKMLEAIQQKKLKIKTAKAGVTIVDEPDLSVEIIAPTKTFDDLNNSSAVIRLVYGDTVFLFMGDAEADSERSIQGDVSADVIKLGHHGSSTSTSDEFLRRVNPSCAIISCGAGNDYGHPHRETIKKMKDYDIIVYRTDKNGNISIESDGVNLTAYTDR